MYTWEPRPQKSSDEKRAAKIAHAERMVAQWMRKQRLAKTYLRKWKARLTRLEYAQKRAAMPPEGGAR